MLELDALLLAPFLSETIELIAQLRSGSPVRRILDLGCGTGTATIALAQMFPAAEVIAVDGSADLLARLRDTATALGIADRVVPIAADVDITWPVIDPVDIAWSALAMHHFGDPDQVLDRAYRATSSSGLLAVLEMDGQFRFLPDDLGIGRPGLEERCHAALAVAYRTALPYLGADWGSRMQRAGFDVVGQRRTNIDIDGTGDQAPTVRRYAQESLFGMRSRLGGRLDADDLATLDTLLESQGNDSLQHRGDIRLRGSRTVWIGRH